MTFTKRQLRPRKQGSRKLQAPLSLACLCAAVTLFGVALAAQQPQTASPSPTAATTAPNAGSPPAASAAAATAAEKPAPSTADAGNRNPNRQIAEESARLLKMANDLMADIEKSNKDTLSIGVIRKADEIERFAHDVRLKMNTEVGAK